MLFQGNFVCCYRSNILYYTLNRITYPWGIIQRASNSTWSPCATRPHPLDTVSFASSVCQQVKVPSCALEKKAASQLSLCLNVSIQQRSRFCHGGQLNRVLLPIASAMRGSSSSLYSPKIVLCLKHKRSQGAMLPKL